MQSSYYLRRTIYGVVSKHATFKSPDLTNVGTRTQASSRDSSVRRKRIAFDNQISLYGARPRDQISNYSLLAFTVADIIYSITPSNGTNDSDKAQQESRFFGAQQKKTT